MKKRSKQLCTLLVAVFALCFAHGTACADEANNDTFHELIDYDALFSTEGQQHIVEEMKEFRGEDEKHFLLSDGSYIAEKYMMPIHFWQDDGWYEIDNTPALDVWNEAEAYSVDSGYVKKLFAYRIKNAQIFKSAVEEQSVTISLPDYLAEESYGVCADVDVLSKNQSHVIYKKLLKSADVELYNVGHDTVVNLVLNQQRSKYSFDLVVDTENLTLNPAMDGGFVFVDNDYEKIFEITKPYAIDSAGAISDNVTFDIEYKDEKAVITMTAAKDWMNQYNREYPVRIISSLRLAANSDSTNSINHISLGSPEAFSQSGHDIYAGYSTSSAVAEAQAIIQLNEFPHIPTGATILSAQLQLRQKACKQIHCPTANFILSQTLGKSPDISNITWSTCPEHKTASVGNVELSDETNGNLICFDITNYVRNAESVPYTFIFHLKDADWYYKQYALEVSLDGKCTCTSPLIITRYTLSDEAKGQLKYEKLSAGNFLTAYIEKTAEDSTLLCSIVNIGTDDDRLLIDQRYSFVKNKWTLSLDESIHTYTTGSKELLVYTDEYGLEHVFTLLSGTENMYVSADSDDLIQKSTEDNSEEYALQKKDGTTKVFHNGYLQSKTNTNGCTFLLAYNYPYSNDSGDWKVSRKNLKNELVQVLIIKPTWSEPEVLLNFIYDQNGNCSEIVTEDGNSLIKYEYADEINPIRFTSIIISEHTEIELQYDKRGNLSRAVDKSKNAGIGITYSDLGDVSKVFEYTIGSDTDIPKPGIIVGLSA